MSLAEAQEFLGAAVASSTLSDKIRSANEGRPSLEIFAAISAVGREEGFDFTPEEFLETFDRYTNIQPLSENELSQVTGGADFAEIHSSQIYTGAGSGPTSSAASAWSNLANDLNGAASGYHSVITQLGSGEWVGPSGASMTGDANSYTEWLSKLINQAGGG